MPLVVSDVDVVAADVAPELKEAHEVGAGDLAFLGEALVVVELCVVGKVAGAPPGVEVGHGFCHAVGSPREVHRDFGEGPDMVKVDAAPLLHVGDELVVAWTLAVGGDDKGLDFAGNVGHDGLTEVQDDVKLMARARLARLSDVFEDVKGVEVELLHGHLPEAADQCPHRTSKGFAVEGRLVEGRAANERLLVRDATVVERPAHSEVEFREPVVL
mmetsp:Transcript_9753/g.29648  ORF Transcript_9753/g.29648 Transcript_9753/m.29648 type:complete len:215 (-) Transcript_9753:704-1348(-)